MRNQRKSSPWRTLSIGIFALVIFISLVILYKVSTNNPNTYATQNGIECQANEGSAYHVHSLLTIFIYGKKYTIPQNIGIASDNSCLYWLHTHDTSGIIHIESPKQISPTLGDFIAIWKNEFANLGYPYELNNNSGWTIYLNGKPYNKGLDSVPLNNHNIITLIYDSPNAKPVTSFDWQSNGL